MRAHVAERFPESVERGEDYGEVDAVMIGADICGWASRVGSLGPPDLGRLRQAADDAAQLWRRDGERLLGFVEFC